MSCLLKYKEKLLLREAYPNAVIMCVVKALQLFDCLLVFESQVLCQLYKKIVNEWLLELETLKLITYGAQKSLALLIKQSLLLK